MYYRSIKRVIFESALRHNGQDYTPLSISDIKQIGGRAGRYRVATDDKDFAQANHTTEIAISETRQQPFGSKPAKTLGLVTSLNSRDLVTIQDAIQAEAPPIRTAGISPPDALILRFANYFPRGTPLSYILCRLYELSRMHERFHLSNLQEWIVVANAIQHIESLTITDRLTFCNSPSSSKTPNGILVLMALARCVANQSSGNLLDIQEINIESLDYPATADLSYLHELEMLHHHLVLYLWLSFRFDGVFVSQQLASHVKSLAEAKIDQALIALSANDNGMTKMKNQREESRLKPIIRQVQRGHINDRQERFKHKISDYFIREPPGMKPMATTV